MRDSWFQHPNCTTGEAEELVKRYLKNGAQVEKSLNDDFLTWTVSVRLPEYKYKPRTPYELRQRVWGER